MVASASGAVVRREVSREVAELRINRSERRSQSENRSNAKACVLTDPVLTGYRC